MPLFTSATASIAGKAGAKARWHTPKPKPVTAEPESAMPANGDSFLSEQLLCIRESVRKYQAKVAAAEEALEGERWSRALGTLAELERN